MTHPRRDFLKSIARAGVLGALADAGPHLWGSPLSAADARVLPDMVRLSPEIEPLVQRIERTSREKCFEMMAERLSSGTPYRQFLAALFLAGIRNVSPQPPGFKFHCVFVIHSAHQLSLDAPVQERLLPLFWALDYFKASQQRDVDEGDFRLSALQGKLPSANQAWDEFHSAMETWDEPRADRAIVALVRSRGAHEIIEGLWRYGARDYRNIGHKAIFVANSWRTLQTIGWQHAEPTLRSLVLGLLDFGKKERVNGYAFEDQCHLLNLNLARKTAGKLAADWTEPASGDATGAVQEILAAVRGGDAQEACRKAAGLLAKGEARAPCVWDAVHLAAGELMMRRPGILGIHTVTSANALHYAFRSAAEKETRLYLLLQGVGWMSQFSHFMSEDREVGTLKITDVEGAEIASDPEEAVEEILELVSSDRIQAAAKAFRYAQKHPVPQGFARAARSLIFSKGRDAHDYKYAAAIFEDYALVDPVWRPHMLATAAYNLRGSDLTDSKVMQHARDVVRSLRA